MNNGRLYSGISNCNIGFQLQAAVPSLRQILADVLPQFCLGRLTQGIENIG